LKKKEAKGGGKGVPKPKLKVKRKVETTAEIKVPTPNIVPDDFVPAAQTPYVICHRGFGHCARGSLRCKKCKAFAEAKHWLLYTPDPDYDGMSCRAVMEFGVGDDKVHEPYIVVGAMKNKAAAEDLAAKHESVSIR
jgi:hypothetical protein